MKKLINFKDIDRARKILDLGVTTSIKEIKDKYRKLSLKYHPDRHNNSSEKKEYEEKKAASAAKLLSVATNLPSIRREANTESRP